jgi:hypothetical protein
MYQLSDAQVEYILNDIRRNGVDMEDLQLNLLDHICCIIEHNLGEQDDFEAFYRQTIKQFYKRELREIEDETIQLLTFKNYYAMKKMMIGSGLFSAAAFLAGSWFKWMHWPGAAILLVLGIVIFSLVFLPLMFTLKTRELNGAQDKLITGIGFFLGIVYCMGVMFKVQHWPGANVLMFGGIIVLTLVFIPLYFLNGYSKPEKRFNTLLTTIILIAVAGSQFTLMRVHKSQPSANEVRIHAAVQK